MAQKFINLGEEPDTAHWPDGVRPVTIDQMERIGVDGKGQLYWDGKLVEIRKRLDLSKGERWFAILVGIATIAGSIGAVAQGWAAAHQWSCQTGMLAIGCPTAPK